MGGSSTKPQLPSVATLGVESGSFSGADVARINAVNTASQKAYQDAVLAAQQTAMYWKYFFISVFPIIGIVALVVVIIHDVVARNTGSQTWMLPGAPAAASTPTTTGATGPAAPVKQAFTNFMGWGSTYENMDESVPSGSTGPAEACPVTSQAPASAPAPAPAPPLFWQWFNGFGTSPGPHDATTVATVSGSSAPLSSANQGGYGMQWWMYVQDWNYGYGRDKPVVTRADPTNPSIQNPAVFLHPTNNSLKFSISVFPSGTSGTVSEPAAAGHAGSTDDVFVCEVPNIPLQSWFSVSMTVFERNLDVYIDGKLVKSCFLNGVPKPAVGDIFLTKDGGYSGLMCDYAYSPKVLMPADAIAFFSKDTQCRSMTQVSTGSAATGYSVKFGVYDTIGKKIQEYTF